MQQFDVIVIGTGVAGQTVAGELAGAGRRVAITDSREYGGTCSLRGCEPKKALFSAAETVERARDQVGGGVTGSAAIDWPALISFKRSFTSPVPDRIERWLSQSGVTVLHGTARFTGEDSVDIGGVGYTARSFVIATGAVPMSLGVSGEEYVIDAERFMASEGLGARIVFVGGGFISFEFAHVAAAAGAACVILHRSARVLKGFDPDLAGMLADAYRASGIDVRTDAPVHEVRKTGDAYEVVCGDGTLVSCDMVVHGAGRVPDVAGLDLAAAGVAVGPRGIEVDASMRSTGNARIFAAGDAAALGAPLTPIAIAQARVARANILEPGSATFAPSVVPSVVFSDPPLASVGLQEAQAADRGLDVDVKFTDTTGWASSRRVGARVSGAKVIVERGSGLVVGAHLLGHEAAEVINVLSAAMLGGLSASDIRNALWAYPTSGSELVYLL